MIIRDFLKLFEVFQQAFFVKDGKIIQKTILSLKVNSLSTLGIIVKSLISDVSMRDFFLSMKTSNSPILKCFKI